jgi:hypothetical protein
MNTTQAFEQVVPLMQDEENCTEQRNTKKYTEIYGRRGNKLSLCT